MNAKRLAAPILVIVLGITWLLNVLEVLPGVDWIWTLGLAAVGLITLLVGGVNRLTMVVGPFLMVSSVCALLRQMGKLPANREVPILTITLGVLMLLVQLSKLPSSELFKADETEKH